MFLFAFWIINFDVPQIFHTIKSVPRLQMKNHCSSFEIKKETLQFFSSSVCGIDQHDSPAIDQYPSLPKKSILAVSSDLYIE